MHGNVKEKNLWILNMKRIEIQDISEEIDISSDAVLDIEKILCNLERWRIKYDKASILKISTLTAIKEINNSLIDIICSIQRENIFERTDAQLKRNRRLRDQWEKTL
jgi:hypothetical protein